MADVLGLLLVTLIVSRKGLPVNVSSPLFVTAQHCVQPACSLRKETPCEYLLWVVFLLLLGSVLGPLSTFLSKKNLGQSCFQSGDVSLCTYISQPLVFASSRSPKASPQPSLGHKASLLLLPPPHAPQCDCRMGGCSSPAQTFVLIFLLSFQSHTRVRGDVPETPPPKAGSGCCSPRKHLSQQWWASLSSLLPHFSQELPWGPDWSFSWVQSLTQVKKFLLDIQNSSLVSLKMYPPRPRRLTSPPAPLTVA